VLPSVVYRNVIPGVVLETVTVIVSAELPAPGANVGVAATGSGV
jgi:hypothetical protein